MNRFGYFGSIDYQVTPDAEVNERRKARGKLLDAAFALAAARLTNPPQPAGALAIAVSSYTEGVAVECFLKLATEYAIADIGKSGPHGYAADLNEALGKPHVSPWWPNLLDRVRQLSGAPKWEMFTQCANECSDPKPTTAGQLIDYLKVSRTELARLRSLVTSKDLQLDDYHEKLAQAEKRTTRALHAAKTADVQRQADIDNFNRTREVYLATVKAAAHENEQLKIENLHLKGVHPLSIAAHNARVDLQVENRELKLRVKTLEGAEIAKVPREIQALREQRSVLQRQTDDQAKVITRLNCELALLTAAIEKLAPAARAAWQVADGKRAP